MTIYRVLDHSGNVLHYQVRIERAHAGKFQRSFATLIRAKRWLQDFVRKNPTTRPEQLRRINRGFRVRDMIISANRAKIINQPKLNLNGCTLERGRGRCALGDRCPHYLGAGGCLDTTEKLNWPGWRALQGDR